MDRNTKRQIAKALIKAATTLEGGKVSAGTVYFNVKECQSSSDRQAVRDAIELNMPSNLRAEVVSMKDAKGTMRNPRWGQCFVEVRTSNPAFFKKALKKVHPGLYKQTDLDD